MMNFPAPARSSFGVVRHEDTVYIAGGHVGGAHNYSRDRFSSDCHALDLSSKTWRPIRCYGQSGDASTAQVVQGVRLLEYGGKIYGFGGFSYEPALDFNNPKDPWHWYARTRTEIYRYDPKADEWLLLGHLPRPRSSYVAGRIGDCAYLIGGWDGTPQQEVGEYGEFGRLYSPIEVFDFKNEKIVSSSFTLEGPMRRAFTSAVAGGSEILVAGGLGQATFGAPEAHKFNWVQAFSPTTSPSWKYLLPLPVNLFSPGLCVVDGTIVVAGGSLSNRKLNEKVFLLRPGATGWTTNSKQPSSTGTFIELIPITDREILVLGGHSGGQPEDSIPLGLCEVLSID